MSGRSHGKEHFPLGRYRLLAPKAGVRVSPLCFGGMSLGDKWGNMMGAAPKQHSFDLLDFFYKKGGNFIDTANAYQGGQSEEFIGEWMHLRNIRNEIVLATKFTFDGSPSSEKIAHDPIPVNYFGNSAKSLKVSVEQSLERLRTHYIDVLYVHFWDYTTSIEELMQSLDHLVKQGKVLYLGISDTPAWVVSKANQYARDHGLSQFVLYQGFWNLANRDFENDIIPMCKAEGMGLAPWGVIGQGKFKTEKQIKEMEEKDEQGRLHITEITELERAATNVLEKIALQKKASIAQVAVAYCMHKTPYVFPIVGGRKIEQFADTIEALKINLSNDEIRELEKACPRTV